MKLIVKSVCVVCVLILAGLSYIVINKSSFDFGNENGDENGVGDENSVEKFEQTARGVRNDCLVAEEDLNMKMLHRNMWSRGSNKIDEVANFQTKIVGDEMNEDTKKAQRKAMKETKKLALSGL